MLKKLFTAAVFIGMTATANAGIITTAWQEDGLDRQKTDFDKNIQTLSLTQFDNQSNTLKLVGVDLEFFGELDSGGTLKNLALNNGSLTSLFIVSDFKFFLNAIEINELNLNARLSSDFPISFETGETKTIDRALVQDDDTDRLSFDENDALFAAFVGTGSVDFGVNTLTETLIGSTAGNFSSEMSTLGSASVKVRYRYEEVVAGPTPVTEPGTLAIFGLALAGFGLRARNNKSAK